MEAQAMAKTKDEGLKTETLGVRVTAEDLARIDALADRIPIATRHAIARHAMRLGLELIEGDPAILLGDAIKGRGKK